MIKINKLTKRFKEQVIFNEASCTLPNRGLVAFVGRSGEGKSTLLNILAMLDSDYQGEITIDNQPYDTICDVEKFRFDNFGFVFQNYSLFNLLSIKDNVMLNKRNDSINESKFQNVLDKVGIHLDINQQVNNLSGGEKQRIAIARALYNEPRVLFCDEPTGALDQENKIKIMSLLKSLSKDILVIIVTHDKKLVEDYAQNVFLISQGKITCKAVDYSFHDEVLLKEKDNSLNLNYMINYIKNNLKKKKYRSIISISSISIGLVCIGIALVITSIVGSSIKQSLLSLMDSQSIVMQSSEDNTRLNEVYASPKTALIDMKSDYQDAIKDIGVFYFSNFEEQFPEENYCSLTCGKYEITFSELSVRSINEYTWVEDYKSLYPSMPQVLEDDEIILRLRAKDIKRINQALYLEDSSSETLSNYLLNNKLYFSFHFKNSKWEYQDELFFYCQYFIEDDTLGIIHSRHNWNEYIFEEIMRFKTSDDLVSLNVLPWTFKKVYYLKTSKNNQTDLVKTLMNDEEYQIYSYTFIDENNSYNLVKKGEKTGRIYVTNQTNLGLTIPQIEQIKKEEKLKYYTISVPNSYIILPSLMVNGFSRATFLSNNQRDLEKINDNYTLSEININQQKNYVDGLNLIYGGLSDLTNPDNLKFNSIDSIDKLYGRLPNNYGEIVISQKIASQLFPKSDNESIINKKIYFQTVKRTSYDGVVYHNEFSSYDLSIVGITDEEKSNCLYHDNQWNIFFYADKLNFPLDELKIDGALFKSDKKISLDNLEDLNLKYSNLSFSNPSLNIDGSIDEIVKYMDLGLMSFAFIAIISSVLMTILVIYLFIVENKKEIGLLKALGIKKKSIRFLFLGFSIALGVISFIYSNILLIINEIVICYSLTSSLELFSLESFLKADLVMGGIIVFISLIIGFFCSFQALRYDPIKVLKEK